ncbi:MAG TPA: hypothetical protein VHG91_10275 [Longimicrobium sp.]|nr:hypothetical protein [Longimicrobium sp.]
MSTRRTPPFSLEGWREVMNEIENGSPDTPERMATFARARAMAFLVEREIEQRERQLREEAGDDPTRA